MRNRSFAHRRAKGKAAEAWLPAAAGVATAGCTSGAASGPGLARASPTSLRRADTRYNLALHRRVGDALLPDARCRQSRWLEVLALHRPGPVSRRSTCTSVEHSHSTPSAPSRWRQRAMADASIGAGWHAGKKRLTAEVPANMGSRDHRRHDRPIRKRNCLMEIAQSRDQTR